MPNRAERRAQQKRARKGSGPGNYDGTNGARSGMMDESRLQARSERVRNGNSPEWTPSANTGKSESGVALVEQEDAAEKVLRAPHSVRQIFRIITWCVIVLSAIAFFVVMWLPNHPMWSIITVSAVFAVGVLSLFFDAGDWHNNPNLDQNGTAV